MKVTNIPMSFHNLFTKIRIIIVHVYFWVPPISFFFINQGPHCGNCREFSLNIFSQEKVKSTHLLLKALFTKYIANYVHVLFLFGSVLEFVKLGILVVCIQSFRTGLQYMHDMLQVLPRKISNWYCGKSQNHKAKIQFSRKNWVLNRKTFLDELFMKWCMIARKSII